MKADVINLLNVAYFVNSKVLEHRPVVSRQDILLQSSPYLEKIVMAVTDIHIVYYFWKISVENFGISNG